MRGFTKRTYVLIFFLIVVIILLAIFIISQIARLNSSNNTNPVSYISPNPTPTSNPISIPITSDLLTYTNSNNYEYKYPSTWFFVNNRDGIGLVPKEVCSSNCNVEILTIAFTKGNQENMDPKIILTAHSGNNYVEGEEKTINGDLAFYAKYQTDNLTDIYYVIAHKTNFISVHFRINDNSVQGVNKDYSKYLQDVTEIVNSIKFLN